MEAGHRLPREYSVVGDILLVYVAVACEEDWRGAQKLANREVLELEPNDGLDARAFLSIDVDIRKVRRISEFDETNVVVCNLLRLREPCIFEELAIVLGRVGAASGGILSCIDTP